MNEPRDPRYQCTREVSRREHRLTCEVRDRLTGRRLISKSDRPHLSRQELRTLLAIPPQVGPQVFDAVCAPDGQLHLILEYLEGRTLDEAVPHLPDGAIPRVVQAICQVLAHLHRAGFVHADLKPSNILLHENGNEIRARLLDFGFALSRLRDLGEEEVRGGTPEFMAPELRRGWLVDGRADQYSLGLVLRRVFPHLEREARWVPILERLNERVATRRYDQILAMRDELESLFDLSPDPDRFPALCAGPMRGRDQLLDAVSRAACAGSGKRLLVQSRPGLGLTRFLLEAQLAIASQEGPSTRLLDVGALDGNTTWPVTESMRKRPDAEPVAEFLRQRCAAGDTVICGIPDPSPGLHWLDRAGCGALRELLLDGSWERFSLPPIDAHSLSETVTDSLGRGGSPADRLAAELHERSDGDLAHCARGFGEIVRCGAREDQAAWELDAERASEKLADLPPPASVPAIEFTSLNLLPSLAILAHAGFSLPTACARSLLKEFSPDGELRQLLDWGYLRNETGGRVAFVTRRLWRELAASPPEEAGRIDAWLLEHRESRPGDIEEILRACRIARRLGDRARESAYLSAAFDLARAEQRWGDLLQLFAYPGEVPGAWDRERIDKQVDALASILGSDWGRERILGAVAHGLNQVDRELSTALREELAQGSDPEVASDAVVLLLNRAMNRSDREGIDRYLTQLEEFRKRGHGPAPGVIEFYRGRLAMERGDRDAARALVETGVDLSRGSGHLYEGFNLQLLAVLDFYRDPRQGIATMQIALDVMPYREQRALFGHTLATMHARSGDHEAAARCANEAIGELQAHISPQRLVALRISRAWAWAMLDQIDRAMREARSLLSLATVRNSKLSLPTVRQLSGFCLLHRHTARAAVIETARAWEEARGGPAEWRGLTLRALIDAILDAEAWDLIAAFSQSVELGRQSKDPLERTTLARAAALCAQEGGRLDEAARLLESELEPSRDLGLQTNSARYLHHLGWVRLAQARDGVGDALRPAIAVFEEELACFAGPGRGYYRAQALLHLSEAQQLAGLQTSSDQRLDEAIDLARGIGSRGLLARCLRTRAQRGISTARKVTRAKPSISAMDGKRGKDHDDG